MTENQADAQPFAEFATPRQSALDAWRARRMRARRLRRAVIGGLCWVIPGTGFGTAVAVAMREGFSPLAVAFLTATAGALAGLVAGVLLGCACFGLMAQLRWRYRPSFESQFARRHPMEVILVLVVFWGATGVILGGVVGGLEGASWSLGRPVPGAAWPALAGAGTGFLLTGAGWLWWVRARRAGSATDVTRASDPTPAAEQSFEGSAPPPGETADGSFEPGVTPRPSEPEQPEPELAVGHDRPLAALGPGKNVRGRRLVRAVIAAAVAAAGVVLYLAVFTDTFKYQGLGDRLLFGSPEGPLEVYYTGGATEADARRLGSFLEQSVFATGHERATVQLSKSPEAMVVSFVVVPGAWQDAEVVAGFTDLRRKIATEVFEGRAVEIHLCDAQMRYNLGQAWLGVKRVIK